MIHSYSLMLKLRKEMLNPGIHRNTHSSRYPGSPKPDPFCLSPCCQVCPQASILTSFLALCQKLPSLLPFLPCMFPDPLVSLFLPQQLTRALDPSLSNLCAASLSTYFHAVVPFFSPTFTGYHKKKVKGTEEPGLLTTQKQ